MANKYNTEKLASSQGGSTVEVSDQAPTPGGLYRHPETGAEIITIYDPLYGDAQSEGIVRLGFVRVGDAPEGSIKSIVEVILDEKQKDNTVTGIADRLAKLEGVRENAAATEAENIELRKQIAQLTAKDTETVQSGEAAKEAALEQTENRGPDNSGPVGENGGVGAGDPITQATTQPGVAQEDLDAQAAADAAQKQKAFGQLNRAELDALAAEEGITIPEEADTNAKIREVITNARAEKENK